MLWYSLVTGIISSVLTCVASTKFHKELPQKATNYVSAKVTALPIGVALAGMAVLMAALFYGLPYATAPWEPESVGIFLIGVGAVLGLLCAIVGWLISRRNRGGWLTRRRCKKLSGWGHCILLYAVAALVAAVQICIDALFA